METTERKKPRPRRSFTPEFKAGIVERCRAGDRTVAQVARAFDLTETAVRKWVTQAEIDAAGADRSPMSPHPYRGLLTDDSPLKSAPPGTSAPVVEKAVVG